MSRILRDPRVRVVLTVTIVVLALLLSLHLVAMGLHGMAMMLGLCLAVLAAAVVLLPRGPVVPVIIPMFPVPVDRPTRARVEPIGRHPPDEGIRLRH